MVCQCAGAVQDAAGTARSGCAQQALAALWPLATSGAAAGAQVKADPPAPTRQGAAADAPHEESARALAVQCHVRGAAEACAREFGGDAAEAVRAAQHAAWRRGDDGSAAAGEEGACWGETPWRVTIDSECSVLQVGGGYPAAAAPAVLGDLERALSGRSGSGALSGGGSGGSAADDAMIVRNLRAAFAAPDDAVQRGGAAAPADVAASAFESHVSIGGLSPGGGAHASSVGGPGGSGIYPVAAFGPRPHSRWNQVGGVTSSGRHASRRMFLSSHLPDAPGTPLATSPS